MLKFNDTVFKLKHGMIGVNRKDIKELVKETVEGIIGLDILIKSGRVALCWEENTVIFRDNENFENKVCLSINYDSIHVKAIMQINGQDISVLLDTGARIDYLNSKYLDHTKQESFETDFNPFLGEMNVAGYETIYTLGETDYSTIAYEQPAILEMTLSLLGVDGIVGMKVFSKAGKTTVIDFEESQIEIIY